MTTANYLETQLPQKKHFVKRIGKKPYFEHYNRLVFLAAVSNILVLAHGLTIGNWWSSQGIAIESIANMMLINFSVAIVIRQQYVINFLFWLATRAPTSWPLAIRWHLAKVYHFGGLHSGGAMAGTVWFALYVGSLTYMFANQQPGISFNLLGITYAMLALLVFIVIMAHPKIRASFHNKFEIVHRFGGWSVLVLFWVQTVIFIQDQAPANSSLSSQLVGAPSFWMLLVLTSSIILPWLRLRKVPVEIVKPSSHVALVRFNHGVTPFPGSSTAISLDPLREWHSFANVPAPGENGFRLTISRAGDWTGDFIDKVPSHVWVKGIPTAGVANIEVLFKRVVYIATGSGIGPVLPHLLAKQVPAHLVWSTRSPRKTYGDDLVDEILEAEPEALVWDTTEKGKPDMVKLAYAAYKSFNAEAVICIANQKLTQEVVYGMESRGIPAYGAIWDS